MVERVDLEVGDVVRLEMGASEVMMYMKVVGQLFEVEVLEHMAQLWKDGREFSIPMAWGEVGILTDQATKKPYAYDVEKVTFPQCTRVGCKRSARTRITWWTVGDPARALGEAELCNKDLWDVEARLDLVIEESRALIGEVK
ncbi:hypothetical protein AB0H73_06325 [Streptomyces olivoreticuli]